MRIRKAGNPAGLLLLISIFVTGTGLCFAQESQQPSPPRTDLLTLKGGKPNLSATGEGITAYKTDEIYKAGTMRVRLLKPEEVKFKIELPTGYTLFNDLIYTIETDTVVTGPTDIVFHLPSARTKETFDQLRIFHPQMDWADPKVPKWIDITLEDSWASERHLSESAFKERLRDFKSRTLHAFTEDAPLTLLVALRDPAKARDGLTADLHLTGSVNPQVTEGRAVTYELKITNKGPDAATRVTLHAQSGFEFVSVDASQGKCNMSAQNVYCKLASLEKDRSIDVKIVERCEWDRHFLTRPPESEPSNPQVQKHISVAAVEQDPSRENNHLFLTTEVYADHNKGPVIEMVSPSEPFQIFPGPATSVPIRFKASDPDGFIKKLELFDRTSGKSLGEPTLRADGEYELIYKNVGYGRQWVSIVATDNLDRVFSLTAPEFFVNGTAKVEIISPKAGSTLNRADGEVTITIRATNSTPLKKVSLDPWEADATPIGNDQYAVKLKPCPRKCRLQAIAIDESGVETRSEHVEFILSKVPTARIAWYDGEYIKQFQSGKPMKVNELMLVASADHENYFYAAEMKKIEIFVDGALICTENRPGEASLTDCVWKPSPGKYRVQAVATDVDGAVGKSEVIEVLIERP